VRDCEIALVNGYRGSLGTGWEARTVVFCRKGIVKHANEVPALGLSLLHTARDFWADTCERRVPVKGVIASLRTGSWRLTRSSALGVVDG